MSVRISSLLGWPRRRILVLIDGMPAEMIWSVVCGVRIYLLVRMRWSWGRSAYYAGDAGKLAIMDIPSISSS
jgi:hypothetical protein